MKQLLRGITFSVILLLASFGVVQNTSAARINIGDTASSTAQDNNHDKGIDAIDAVTDAISDYIDKINAIVDTDDSTQISAAHSSGTNLQNKLNALQEYSFTANFSAEYVAAIDSIKLDAAELNTRTANLNNAFTSGDVDNINNALNLFNAAATSFDESVVLLGTSIEKHNAPLEEQNQTTGTLYVVASIATAIITIVTFAWKPRNETAYQKSFRINAGKQSLWPLGGALITTIWFFSADGSYMILWGAILIGFAIYAKALWNAIQAYRNQQYAISGTIIDQAGYTTPTLAKLYKISEKDTPNLNLLVTLTLEALYAFSLFNTSANADEEASKEQLVSRVEDEVNRLALIDGKAKETKATRDKIYAAILRTANDYADSSRESRRIFAIIGAASFLTKEHGEDFSITSPNKAAKATIEELARYQAVIDLYT